MEREMSENIKKTYLGRYRKFREILRRGNETISNGTKRVLENIKSRQKYVENNKAVRK